MLTPEPCTWSYRTQEPTTRDPRAKGARAATAFEQRPEISAGIQERNREAEPRHEAQWANRGHPHLCLAPYEPRSPERSWIASLCPYSSRTNSPTEKGSGPCSGDSQQQRPLPSTSRAWAGSLWRETHPGQCQVRQEPASAQSQYTACHLKPGLRSSVS